MLWGEAPDAVAGADGPRLEACHPSYCHSSYLSSVIKQLSSVTWGTAASVRAERAEGEEREERGVRGEE